MSRPVFAAQAALVAALCGATGVIVDALVDGHWPVAVAGAAAVGAVVSMVALRAVTRRATARPTGMLIDGAAVLSGGFVAALVVAFVAPASPTSDRSGVSAVVDGAIHGWASLATSDVPSPVDPRLLVPIALAVWGAAALSTLLIDRSSSTFGPLLPILALLILASVAAGSFPNAPVAVGTAFVALGGLVVLVRTWHGTMPSSASAPSGPDRSGRRAPLLVGSGVLALGAIGAITLGPDLSFGRDEEPFDPRQVLDPPVAESRAASPLELVASTKLNPDEVVFDVSSDGPLTVRLVSMASFDGVRWTTGGTYERVGRSLPGAEVDVPAPSTTRVEFWIEGLDGPWLPSVDEPQAIVGLNALIDPVARSFVAPADSSGANYVIEADVPALDVSVLRSGLPVADDPEARAAVQLPAGFPTELRTLAEQATAQASSPFEEAVLLNDLLAQTLTVEPARPGGHSYGHLMAAVTGSRVVNEEQLASLFAVLARSIGLPTRVTVGIAPDAIEPSGRRSVRAKDLSVWPEVRFDDIGWVAFRIDRPGAGDAIPSVLVGLGEEQDVVASTGWPEAEGLDGESDGGPTGGELVDPDLPARTRPIPGIDEALDDSGRGVRWPVVLAAGAGVLIASVVVGGLVVITIKRRRTRRRRSEPDPRASVVGAWHDVLDRLEEVGELPVERLTVDQIVESDRETVTLAAMYRPLNRALYDSRPVEPSDAEAVWRARDRFVETIDKNATARGRLRRAVDPRPLRPAGSRSGHVREGLRL